jgi:hypothetical protein
VCVWNLVFNMKEEPAMRVFGNCVLGRRKRLEEDQKIG